MVGAELGYMSSLQRTPWTASSGVGAPESAELRGGYFRLIVGGGSVSFRDHGHHDTNE